MIYKLKNMRGQEVGEFDTETKVYSTIRDKNKNEIFIKKQWFNGKFYETPVGIDLRILNKLLKFRCKRIDILVLNLRARSFLVSFAPEDIFSKGTEICYDKFMGQKNISKYDIQVVFGLERGLVGGSNQDTLDGY